MKQINYKINTRTGVITTDSKTTLNELENFSTSLSFTFDKIINDQDKLLIIFINSKNESKVYKLDRLSSNKYNFLMPREVLTKGRLYFSIQHYDKDLIELAKYTPETYLYVSQSLDITANTMADRPDIFAEMFYRIQKLEEQIKNQG